MTRRPIVRSAAAHDIKATIDGVDAKLPRANIAGDSAHTLICL